MHGWPSAVTVSRGEFRPDGTRIRRLGPLPLPPSGGLIIVVNRHGRVVVRVALNRDEAIVGFGFGVGTVYVVRTEEEGLNYLSRHLLAAGGALMRDGIERRGATLGVGDNGRTDVARRPSVC